MTSTCRSVFAIFVLSILIFNASAYPSYQTPLTSADKKAILSVLFEQEVSASQNEQPRVILLAPGTDLSWLLDLPGIRFKRLSYGEEKQVSEYYELRDGKTPDDAVEVWLSKGNYCKKVGTAYEFRKEESKWKAKITKGSESFSDSGAACVGCKTGSGSVYSLKRETTRPEQPKDLLLTGKALAVRCRRDETKYIRCEVDLSLDFSNKGTHAIIILQPYGEYEFWQGARSLALSKADSDANIYVYKNAAWPHVYETEKYRVLAEALDQPTPPAQVTRTIGPGESWTWTTTIKLFLSEENTCSGSVGVEIGWREIKKLPAPLWLEVSYEMWPFNVENFKENLGGQLRERWKSYGNLYLEEKFDRYWYAHLTSEPIELDFQRVQLKGIIK